MKIEFSICPKLRVVNREFIFLFYVTSFYHLSLGFHLDLASPNIEVHLPFSFIRFGWSGAHEFVNSKGREKYFKITVIEAEQQPS